MRIALVCRPFVFHGGVEMATAGLVAELVRQGERVELISTAAQPEVPGVEVTRLAVPEGPRLVRLLGFAVAVRRRLARGAHDVVQSHERCLQQDVYRAGEGTHRGYLQAMARSPRADPYHHAVILLERRIFSLRAAREIVAISAAGKAEIERLYGTPAGHVSVVYNGVDLERFHPARRLALRSDARREIGASDRDWVVGFVGSGFERKGLGPLIAAVAHAGPGVRLAVAGRGNPAPYVRLAERLGLGGAIAWLGARPDVERVYAAADVVALPARYEPFGNVHLEALACGLPVLTAQGAGGAEVVEHGVSGWVAPAPEAGAIADGLRQLRDADPDRIAAMARTRAESFTHARQVAALRGIWEAAAGRRDAAQGG